MFTLAYSCQKIFHQWAGQLTGSCFRTSMLHFPVTNSILCFCKSFKWVIAIKIVSRLFPRSIWSFTWDHLSFLENLLLTHEFSQDHFLRKLLLWTFEHLIQDADKKHISFCLHIAHQETQVHFYIKQSTLFSITAS